MQRLRLLALLALCVAGLVPTTSHAQTGAPVQIGVVSLTKVEDWEGGALTDLLVTNNSGGEIRLAAGATRGVFESGLLPTNFRANAVALTWRSAQPEGTQLALELRGGAAGGQLGDWRAVATGDARPNGDAEISAVEAVLALPSDTNFVQVRATLTSSVTNASAVLDELVVSYFNTQPGPAQVAGLPRVPVLAGAATLTPAPQIIERQSWSGAAPTPVNPARVTPRGIVIHQIGDNLVDAPLPYLRALLNYHTKTLGWDDMPFHYLIDGDGNLYEGRAGGPTTASREKIGDVTRVTSRMAGGDAVIHVALIGAGAPNGNSLVTLRGLLAWLGQAYAIAPLGTHRFTPPDSDPTERPNIATHAEISAVASDPSSGLRDQITEIRRSTDQATVRARWYFAEGNAQDYAERLAVLNPTNVTATVRFILLRQPGPAVVRETTVAAGGRADLIINEIFNDTTDVPAIVESNAAVIVERYMDFGSDISMSMGVRQPSRVWYFAEGATDQTNRTFLVLFNPQLADVQATITYIRDDGIAAQQPIRIPALQRRVIVVGDKLNGARFGMRVVATRPVVAERTMIFGQGSTLDGGGVHTAPGVTELSRRWYFAEGTTERPFQMAVLVMNPNAQPVDAAVTFLTPDGTSLTRRYAIPATTRLSINVNEVVPQLGVATTVVTDRPVVVERTITWNSGTAGTAGAGATEPAYTWRFADGRTIDTFQEFLLVSNPGKGQARVTVEYTLADGTRVSDAAFTMPGGSRQTVAVHGLRPGQLAIAATVRASQPIVVERSVYRGDPRALGNQGGETVLGIPGDNP
jgi:N-acetylmuramoyl-L-alanine amidase